MEVFNLSSQKISTVSNGNEINEQMEEGNMSKRLTHLTIVAAAAIIPLIAYVVFVESYSPYGKERWYNRIICKYNMKKLGVELMRYALDHNDLYPDPNKWCDIISPNMVFDKEIFRCPDDKIGPCSYAMNPDCNSFFTPNDVVLLFETTGGWNKSGGPQLLNPDNHIARGSNVLFNNGQVELIEPKDFDKLRWK